MQQVMAILSGKKTYLVGIAGIVYSVGLGLGWWPHSAASDIILSLGLLSPTARRLSVKGHISFGIQRCASPKLSYPKKKFERRFDTKFDPNATFRCVRSCKRIP